MARTKYKYNPHTLSYDEVELTTRDRVFKVLKYIGAGLVFATTTLIIAFAFFKSPREIKQERELANLQAHYDKLNEKLGEMELWLNEIQEKDDYTYRLTLEMEPVPDQLRQGGRGGYDRYKSLEGFEYSDLVINTTQRLDQLTKKMYVQSKSLDEVILMAKDKEQMLQSIPAIQPIAHEDLTRLASGFGYRTHPIYKTVKMHTGMDFSAPRGTEIYATGNGVVERADSDASGYGKHVVIDHGYGYETLYGHMTAYAVNVGDEVVRGQVIGYVGSTGTSVSPHLHYEVIKNGVKIDPINFYSADFTPEQYAQLRIQADQAGQSFD